MMIKLIKKLSEGRDLEEQEIMEAMYSIMEGEATPAQIGSFITALGIKGETVEEITGCVKVMREKAGKITPDVQYCIDTCGTGGDGANTFNISTAAAIVAAAGGAYVAKHGNRAMSGKSGSADVLEELGVNIMQDAGQVKECIEKTGIGFMFAQNFHKSMKYAAAPRKEIGIKTVFNILGPLSNPAGAKGQVLGVFDGRLTEKLADVLLKLGVEKALVIHGMDGLDELTTTTETKVSEIKDGKITSYIVKPEDVGLERSAPEELTGGNAKDNAAILLDIFSGEKGRKRDIVLLNAAAALYVAKIAGSLREGVELSMHVIDSGQARGKLNEFREFSSQIKEI